MTDMGIDWICWIVYYACMRKKKETSDILQ